MESLPSISILLPTRGRKLLAERFIRSAFETASQPDLLEFVLYVDDDDQESRTISVDRVKMKTIVGPKQTMGYYNTRCFEESGGDIIVLGNDDVIVKTDHWDDALRGIHEKYSDRIYLAYPNDLNKGSRLSAFPVLSRSTCMMLGEAFPKIYKGSFIDTHIMEIFERLKMLGHDRICYLDEVWFEHMHFRLGKHVKDKTYENRNRFSDDMNFLSLAASRKESAKFFEKMITGERKAGAYAYQEPARKFSSYGLAELVRVSAAAYLFDGMLPWGYKIKRVGYFVLRWLVSKMAN